MLKKQNIKKNVHHQTDKISKHNVFNIWFLAVMKSTRNIITVKYLKKTVTDLHFGGYETQTVIGWNLAKITFHICLCVHKY